MFPDNAAGRFLTVLCCALLWRSVPVMAEGEDSAGGGEAPTFAVRVAPGAAELTEALGERRFYRVVGRSVEDLHPEVGPEAAGDVEVWVETLPASDRLKLLLTGLPVELRDHAIVFAGDAYDLPETVLAMRIPGAPKPTHAVVGMRAGLVASTARSLVASLAGSRTRGELGQADYLLREHSLSRRSGSWRVRDGAVTTDPDERNDPAARAAAYAALTLVERPRVVLRVAAARAGEPAVGALADALEAAAAAMAPRVGLELDRPLEVIVETDYVAEARHLGRIGGEMVDHRGRLHIVHHPDDLAVHRYGLARLLVRRASLGLPPWLEDGAALWLSRDWYGRPYAEWLPDLAFGRVLPTAAELVAGERQDASSNVLWPVAAAGVVERLPGATLSEKLRDAPSRASLTALLERLEKEGLRQAGSPAAKPRVAPGGARFHRGVSLAMAPGNVDGGYHAPEIDEKLVYLREMGVDSVALMPLAIQRRAALPDFRYNQHGHAKDETDVGLVHAARRAHALGLRVMWKPHVFSGEWSGTIAMASEEDWQAWWRTYRSFVLHHAVLARWTGSELFAVGVELGKTVEREEWRHLIRSVRRIYPGRLTYAANWWSDYERVPFWDDLDLVGIDAYFPLADTREVARSELEAGARRVAENLAAAARRFGRPVLLTEVGFAAREGAWVTPHEEGGTFSEEHQAVAYETLLGVLGRPPWLEGMFLWKVFSFASAEGGGDWPDFRFLGRRAEPVIRGYFTTAE